MEPPTQMMGCNGRCRIAVAQRLRRGNLPRRKPWFILHCFVVAKNACAFLLSHQSRAEPRCLRRLTMDMDQDILDIRLLTPYAVHPDTANDITDQP